MYRLATRSFILLERNRVQPLYWRFGVSSLSLLLLPLPVPRQVTLEGGSTHFIQSALEDVNSVLSPSQYRNWVLELRIAIGRISTPANCLWCSFWISLSMNLLTSAHFCSTVLLTLSVQCQSLPGRQEPDHAANSVGFSTGHPDRKTLEQLQRQARIESVPDRFPSPWQALRDCS